MTLRFATIEELDATVTAPLLRRLTEAHPNIAFSFSSGASHENHDALASRAVDLMLAVDTVGDAEWVEMHPVLHDPFILIRSAGLPVFEDHEAMTAHPFIRYASALQIGRHIEAQLRRTGLRLPKRFEFSSNRALFEASGALGGWAITTAFAHVGTAIDSDPVEAQALPLPGFSRRLALYARAGALGDLPARIAQEIRDCMGAHVLPAAHERLPFLGQSFRVLEQ
jgi:DNA-binding transcriptional LysR family regulator